jgi:hypothetical protein
MVLAKPSPRRQEHNLGRGYARLMGARLQKKLDKCPTRIDTPAQDPQGPKLL